ncbi:MAG: O-methyltransferase [Lachnospiraceae bacterium]|nr:O-methyltransferase [Lachnospiraceae bacterium]
MIIDERYLTFMNSFAEGNTEFLENLEADAIENYVPIIRKDMQNFIKVFLQMKQPKRILEVGAAIGFSSVLMATYNPVQCTIDTIENYDKRIPIATKNIKDAGFEDVINLHYGDAAEILPTLEGPYDFIFMDAAKGQYPVFFPMLKALTKPGTVLITDNVLQDGDIIESHFAVTRRNRTIYKRMRDFLFEAGHDKDFSSTILPVGDGISLLVRK